MTIQITRVNVALGYDLGILSQERFKGWDAAFDALEGRDLPLSEEHRQAMRENEFTSFDWTEFVSDGAAAYSGTVRYEIEVLPDPEETRP